MLDLDIIPCIRDHKHLWNAHKVCQWCNNEKDHIELLALRMRIEELEEAIEKHKKFVLANYDEPDCSIPENLSLWEKVGRLVHIVEK